LYIASIEILKDASATAIYGTRAANGVIIITTKGGNTGKMKVNVDYQFGVSETPTTLDIQDGTENRIQNYEFILRGYEEVANQLLLDPVITIDGVTYNTINRELLEQTYTSRSDIRFEDTFTGGQSLTFPLPGFYEELLDLNLNTDWQDEVFQTGNSHRANIELLGGKDALNYFVSAGYNTQEGILIGNQFDRFNGTATLKSKINDRLSANLNLNFIYTENNRLPENQDLGYPLQAIVLPPSDFYDPANDYRLLVRTDYNPLTEANFSTFVETNNSLLGNLGLKYKLNDNLQVDVNGGIDNGEIDTDRFQGPQTEDGSGNPNGRTRRGTQSIRNWIFNGWLTYSSDQSAQNRLEIILGTSYQQSKTSFTFFDSFSPNTDPIQGAANAFSSIYTRINYTLGSQFDFQVSGRMDGSSKFPEENRFGVFPSASAGWRINNAPFFGSDLFQLLKVRGSFGIVGNTPVDDFLYRKNYFLSRYDGDLGVELANLSNQSLKWENTSQLNIGFDFAILNERINGSVDYYVKTTTDLLFAVPVTQTSGFSTIFDNIGEMENKGFEFNLNTLNVQTADFSWTTDFNISSNENTIIDLKGEQAIVGVNAFLEGESAGVFYLREFVGVDPETGDALYSDGNGGTTTDWESAPRKVLGDPNPQLFGGITNSLSYKSFDLSFMFQFVSGIDLYWATGEFLANSAILNLGQAASQTDRWYEAGDQAPNPRLDPQADFPLPSSRWIENGDYLRLKTVTLTYNFPQSVLSNLGLTNMSIYVGGSNLWTSTDYPGFDPDVSYFDPLDGIIGQNITRGVDQFNAPQPRIIMSGIKIGF
jgi:TonB-linked SusC/RagA family outer membrane protein